MEHSGWLLDLYSDPQQGIVLWLLDEDGSRRRLHQPFPITFYAAGDGGRLRNLWRYLQAQPIQVKLGREERSELGSAEPLSVLAIQVLQADEQPRLFAQALPGFSRPDLLRRRPAPHAAPRRRLRHLSPGALPDHGR